MGRNGAAPQRKPETMTNALTHFALRNDAAALKAARKAGKPAQRVLKAELAATTEAMKKVNADVHAAYMAAGAAGDWDAADAAGKQAGIEMGSEARRYAYAAARNALEIHNRNNVTALAKPNAKQLAMWERLTAEGPLHYSDQKASRKGYNVSILCSLALKGYVVMTGTEATTLTFTAAT